MEPIVLDQLDPRELGQNLRIAREQRGLRQADAAEFIDVARTTLTAIEQGKRRINLNELRVLARAYGRTASDFLRPRPLARDFQVQYRGPSRMQDGELAKIAQSQTAFQELCRNYVELETIMDAPLMRRYPPLYSLENLSSKQAAESIAAQERNRLGLGDGPLPLLRSTLEQEVGLRIFYMPLTDSNFSEMYYYDDELGGCIAVNRNHSEERRRWSLVHAYAHFLVHRYQPFAYLEGVYEREQFADYFAKYFLMPTSSLIRRYQDTLQSREKPTIGDLSVLAYYYGVSLAAFVRRLEDLNMAPVGTWERMRERGSKVRQAQQQLGFPPIPAQEQILPLRYQYLAVEAFEQGQISEGLFARFLLVDRLEARHIAQLLSKHSDDVTSETRIDLNVEEQVGV
jgi:Zn-dependent peptidase ImmA (M78 family)/transcriptional regulator with XRE-family HTH domain